MQNDATTIYVKTRENAVDAAVSRGKQMFQALTEPNEKIDETMLAAKLAEKLRISLSEATYYISSLDELIIKELKAGNHVYLKLASFYSRLSGPLPTKDADPVEAGLYMLGCVRARPQLRNALKDCLTPSNVLSSERITIHDVFDTETKRHGAIGIDHLIHVAGINVAVNPDAVDEGVWIESDKGEVMARGEVYESDSQVLSCRFRTSVVPGKCYFVLKNRSQRKGSDYELQKHRIEINVTVDEGI